MIKKLGLKIEYVLCSIVEEVAVHYGRKYCNDACDRRFIKWTKIGKWSIRNKRRISVALLKREA